MKNAISWFDIPTKNFDRAVKFYSDILDEEIKVSDYMGQKLGFFPMEKGSVSGDIVPPDKSNKPSTTGTRVYLNCNGKLDTVLSRVEKAKGKIIKQKFSIGEQGFIAMIEDSEGNIIGLHSI